MNYTHLKLVNINLIKKCPLKLTSYKMKKLNWIRKMSFYKKKLHHYACPWFAMSNIIFSNPFTLRRSHLNGPPLIFLEHGALHNIKAKKCFPPSNRRDDASSSKSFVSIYSPLVLHSFKYPFVVLEVFGL